MGALPCRYKVPQSSSPGRSRVQVRAQLDSLTRPGTGVVGAREEGHQLWTARGCAHRPYNVKASQPLALEAIWASDCLLSIGYRPIDGTSGDVTAALPVNTIRARGHSVDIGDSNYQAVTLKEVLRGVIGAAPQVEGLAWFTSSC